METAITIEALYELMKEFKEDMRQFRSDVYRRFNEQDKRFEQQERRMDRLEEKMERGFEELKALIRQDHEKLEKVYEARERIQLRFTRAWGFASLLMGVLGGAAVVVVERMVT